MRNLISLRYSARFMGSTKPQARVSRRVKKRISRFLFLIFSLKSERKLDKSSLIIQNSPYDHFHKELADARPYSISLAQKDTQSDSESSIIVYDDAGYGTRFSLLSLSSRKSLLG